MTRMEAACELRVLAHAPARDPLAHALMCLELALVADGLILGVDLSPLSTTTHSVVGNWLC